MNKSPSGQSKTLLRMPSKNKNRDLITYKYIIYFILVHIQVEGNITVTAQHYSNDAVSPTVRREKYKFLEKF